MGMVETLPSFSLQALEVGMVPPRRDGVDRHKCMLVGHEFDIAEVSLASDIISKRAGAPFCAVPVFPRRLFSQNHIFVKADAGIENPKRHDWKARCDLGVSGHHVRSGEGRSAVGVRRAVARS
jgi:4,5-dihydroxyphthalate decarboxylase